MIAKYQARPKPAAVHVTRDNRELCADTAAGKREYYNRTRQMAARQQELCAICKEFMVNPTFDHERTRGGGNRDDRIEVGGKWKNAAVCYECNGIKGSRRYKWQDGTYLPINQGEEHANDRNTQTVAWSY